MQMQIRPEITLVQMISPVIVALVVMLLLSLLREPARRNLSALLIAGAGAAYLNGGLGPVELGFCAVLTFIAYRGLADYRFVGLGWLMHTGWDVVHHLYGNPIVPFQPLSSFGCAICDVVLALWYFASAPSLYEMVRRKNDARE